MVLFTETASCALCAFGSVGAFPMNLTNNTILITGGGSGIGQALAHEFHQRGNQVIIAGRRRSALDETVKAHPGMAAVELDVSDPTRVTAFAREVSAQFPKLNVLMNNAGIMQVDDLAAPVSDELLTSTMDINLLGPIRLVSAFVDHFKRQPAATIVNVTSGLAFTPRADAALYSATKAAIHSYTLSLRYQLRGSPVRVLEVLPPRVQTDLTPGQRTAANAMPLADYIAETMTLLATDADEILVERVKAQRNNAGPNEHAFFNTFNDRLRAAAK